MGNISIYKLENEPKSLKVILKYLIFGSKFGFRGPFMIEIIPHTIGNWIFPLKCGFGIGYDIGRMYQPIFCFGYGIRPKPK